MAKQQPIDGARRFETLMATLLFVSIALTAIAVCAIGASWPG